MTLFLPDQKVEKLFVDGKLGKAEAVCAKIDHLLDKPFWASWAFACLFAIAESHHTRCHPPRTPCRSCSLVHPIVHEISRLGANPATVSPEHHQPQAIPADAVTQRSSALLPVVVWLCTQIITYMHTCHIRSIHPVRQAGTRTPAIDPVPDLHCPG